MNTDDVLTGIGTAISTAMAAISWLWNVGFLQLLFSFLTGSFATYFVQSRLQDRAEKRQIARNNFNLMRERIYGPLFNQLNRINEDLKAVRITETGKTQGAKDDHLYFMIPEGIRKSIEKFFSRIENYGLLVGVVEGIAEQISREAISQDLHPSAMFSMTLHYKLFVGPKHIQNVELHEALMMDSTPKQILESRAAGLKIFAIDRVVGGYGYSDNDAVDKACEKALQKIRHEDTFQKKETERKSLIQEAETVISSIKPYIELEVPKSKGLLRR
jgi:hypothetical protein